MWLKLQQSRPAEAEQAHCMTTPADFETFRLPACLYDDEASFFWGGNSESKLTHSGIIVELPTVLSNVQAAARFLVLTFSLGLHVLRATQGREGGKLYFILTRSRKSPDFWKHQTTIKLAITNSQCRTTSEIRTRDAKILSIGFLVQF